MTVFHKNPTSSLVERTVVVGNVALPDDSKLDPHVIALAEPLSVILTINESPLTGVPDKLEVIEVIA